MLSLLLLPTASYAAIIDVSVGGFDSLEFSPNSVSAEINDIVRFTFAGNHSVAQSSFAEPCARLKSWFGYDLGFESGFERPTFDLLVNDTQPVWAFCQQGLSKPTHCQSGMVFAVNPPESGDTFEVFSANAKASTVQDVYLSPAEDSPAEDLYEPGDSFPSPITNDTYPPPESLDSFDDSTTTDDFPPLEDSYSFDDSSTPDYSPPLDDSPPIDDMAYYDNHFIVVGGSAAGFTYTPSNITAKPGDTVTFAFMSVNHTVTQSSFDQPCRRLAATTTPPVDGFDSGFMPVAANATLFPTYKIKINDTNPIWGYCRQQTPNFSHCGVGMVFSINAKEGTDRSFAAFQNLAVKINGTGIVDPFGNLTVRASTTLSSVATTTTTTYNEYATPYITTTTTSAGEYGNGYGYQPAVEPSSGGENGYAAPSPNPAPYSNSNSNAGGSNSYGYGKIEDTGFAASSNLDSSSSNDSSKLDSISKLQPATIGLLAVSVFLLLVILGIGGFLLLRNRGGSKRKAYSERGFGGAQPGTGAGLMSGGVGGKPASYAEVPLASKDEMEFDGDEQSGLYGSGGNGRGGYRDHA